MTVTTSSGSGLLPAAEQLAELAGKHAARSDAGRELPCEIVDELRRSGFPRHFVPARWGGTEGTFTEVTNASAAVGRRCAATAWCASLTAYSGRFASFLPAQGQSELWKDGPDQLIATGLVPSGSVREVEGGRQLKGRWSYVSGIDCADWVLLCGPAPDGTGVETGFFAVPRDSCRTVPTWDGLGLRATGSHTVELDEVLVPAHRWVSRARVFAAADPASPAVCHRTPFRAVGTLTFVAPALGAAEGVLEAAVEALSGKRRSPSMEEALARASARTDAARLLVQRNAAVADAGEFTPELLARNERDAAYAAESLRVAVNDLMTACGTSGLSESGALQRLWRDTLGAVSHVALRYETAPARNFVDTLLGPAR